jgi:uncharacterized damage-inducible protein DinB
MDELLKLLTYTKWADARLMDGVAALSPADYGRDLGSSFASIRDTLTHLYGADRAWLLRVRGETPEWAQPADYPDPDSLWAAWREVLDAWPGAVRDTGNPEKVIGYRTFDGTPYETSLGDIVRHVVNHGTYHRGQVTTMLRQLGAAAPATDFIRFVRLGGAA